MEEFKNLDFTNMLAQRIFQNQNQQSFDFDPYQTMLNKNIQIQNDSCENFIQYNAEDIMELENFCKQHGILGINFGTCDPKATLKMLKSKIGYRSNEEKSVKKSLLLD